MAENETHGEWTLPDGWELISIRDAFEIHYGKGLVKSKRDESGSVPVYGSSGVVGYHSHALIDGPCIVVGRKGAIGQVYYSKVSCWPIDTTYYIQPSEEFSLGYLHYALDFIDLGVLDKSTAIPGLNRDDFYSQLIPIPPTNEQRRIVAEIETQFTRLDAGVAALKGAQANLKRYRASVLKAACAGRLVPQDPADEPADKLLARILVERRAKWEAEHPGKKYKEPAPPDETGLPELPEGWTWATVEQLASPEPRSIQSGPFGSNLLHSEFQDTGILAIGIDNVLEGQFSMGKQHRISPEKFEQLRRFEARPLDVLITVMATVGRCCVVPPTLETAIITKHVYRISANR